MCVCAHTHMHVEARGQPSGVQFLTALCDNLFHLMSHFVGPNL